MLESEPEQHVGDLRFVQCVDQGIIDAYAVSPNGVSNRPVL